MKYNGVAIAGKAGAGKNTLARQLQAELWERGIWAVEFGFADALKAEMWELHGLTKEMPGGREMLVQLGHGRRERDPHYWIGRLAARLDSLSPYGIVPVITDMRYANEMKWATWAGLITVRVDATGMDRAVALARRGEDPDFAYSDVPSEVELDDATFDVRFWNAHGSVTVIPHMARVVADLLDGTAERVAA